ncbi:MAG: hypothetical protein HUU56_11050 [Bdellovibrionaceae bacterium]|nr:hypothetical protein [Pseudobdellovibrionaceae bacterium]
MLIKSKLFLSNFRVPFVPIFLLFLSIFLGSCGGNLFQLTAKKDTTEAVYQDMKVALNNLDYDTAISKALELQTKDSSFYLKCEKIDGMKICPREDLAGAYASKCGLNFVTFVSSLTSSSGSPFLFFMQKFKSVTITPAMCYEAQKVIETFGADSTSRTTEQNLFMAILGMAKMGTYLRDAADQDQDGSADSTYDSCSSDVDPNTSAKGISEEYLRQVVSGMGLVIDNLASVTAALSGGSSALTALETIKNTCGAACSITDPNSSSFNPTVTRNLLKSSDQGIETSSGCTFPCVVCL